MNFRGKYITVGRSRRCDKTDGNFKKWKLIVCGLLISRCDRNNR
jgi:hypothetical protein